MPPRDLPAEPMAIEASAAERLPTWDPGVRGGIAAIPERLVMTADYVRRFPDFTAALNAAVAEVQAPGAVKIPGRAAPYELTGPVTLRDGVVVRGEGPRATTLAANIAAVGPGIDGSGFHAALVCKGDRLGVLDVAGDLPAGATSFDLAGPAGDLWPEPGQDLILTMDNDPAHGWNRFDWEQRVRGQLVRVTAVDGARVTVDTPLRLAYPAQFKPRVELIRAIEGAGVEDLCIVNDAATQANWSTAFWYAVGCWLRNVEIVRVPDVASWVWNSRWVTLEGCHVHDARDYSGGKGYGVNVCSHSSDCLVTNSVFERLRHSMLTHFGASGNVFAYNYSREPAMSDASLHGWYPYMNLFEGNAATQIYADNAWGRAGEHNTFFRNRLLRFWADYEARLGVDFKDYADHSVESIQVDPDSNQQNVLGNTILDSHVILRGCASTWVEKTLMVDVPDGQPPIYTEGNVTGTVDQDNHRADVTPPDPGPAPFRASLFLAAPPGFWDTDQRPWPAIGADVDRPGAEPYPLIPAEARYQKLSAGYKLRPWRPSLTAAGRRTGLVGEDLVFRAVARHSDPAARLQYVFDWGDGTASASDLTQPGTPVRLVHAWAAPGTYQVRCQARDQFGSIGAWSKVLAMRIA